MNIRLRLLTILLLLLLAGITAGATTFAVNNTNDAGTGSLRAAIIAANADNTATAGSPHIINATGISGTINLQTALPLLDNHMTINGPGSASLTVTRGVVAAFRIFSVGEDRTVTLSGMTITNGSSVLGGGINNDGGALTVTNCTISGNTTTTSGGGIRNAEGILTVTGSTFSNNSAPNGGGIHSSDGALTVTGSTFSDNSATERGGGIQTEGTATVSGSVFTDNVAEVGGGIFSQSTIELTSTTLSDNTASFAGGGLYNSEGEVTMTGCAISDNAAPQGGGIRSNEGSLTMSDCTISDNTATDRGGGIDTDEGPVTLSDCTISGNDVTDGVGGGISIFDGTVTLSGTMLSGNTASDGGGGIYITDSGELLLSLCTITSNTTSASGGGIMSAGGILVMAYSTFSGNTASGQGGGIYKNEGGMVLENSMLSDNISSDDGGGISNKEGGITLTNTTLSGNTATNDGGGIYNEEDAARLTNCTLSGNHAARGGGIFRFDDDVLPRNTIIAGNTASTNGPDVYGAIGSQGYNLIGNTSGSSGWVASDLQNVDAHLSSLQDNGGPTLTMAINCTSPALDAGDNTDAPETDQRGEPRIVDGNCDRTEIIDIGAYEFQNTSPPTIVLTSSAIELSPVNHNYRTVNVGSFVTNVTESACTNLAASDVIITHVTSDEPEDANGGGDGNTQNDILIASNCKSVQLRAERDGNGNGRVYRIYVRVTDDCGHADEKSFKVSVRKGNGAAVEGSVAYSETSSCSIAPKQVMPIPAPQLQLPTAQSEISLMENYPNPFSTSTVINYNIGTAGPVRLTVFDMNGRVVATLVNEVQIAGEYSILFRNTELPSGTYYYTLESNGEQRTGSMLVMR
jgi:parallel beta-helix repeat protein/predicted outer membrane repeat protein